MLAVSVNTIEQLSECQLTTTNWFHDVIALADLCSAYNGETRAVVSKSFSCNVQLI